MAADSGLVCGWRDIENYMVHPVARSTATRGDSDLGALRPMGPRVHMSLEINAMDPTIGHANLRSQLLGDEATNPSSGRDILLTADEAVEFGRLKGKEG